MKKLHQIVFVVLLIIAGASSALAQSLSNAIVVDENVLVSGDTPARPHVEPCVAADPADAQHLIAASIAFTRPDHGSRSPSSLHSTAAGVGVVVSLKA